MSRRRRSEAVLSEDDVAIIVARLLASLEFESLNWAVPQFMTDVVVEKLIGVSTGAVAGKAALTNPTNRVALGEAGDAALTNPTYTLAVA